MATAVIQGATLQCTCGNAPSKLIVSSQPTDLIGGALAATVMDNGPNLNILPFGTCKTLTAAASGTPTPCVPATPARWTPGSTSTMLIGNYPALLSTDKLSCTVGGAISITDPGQQPTTDT
ncbi:MAG: DUF4280 domain-containing protein [Planctomycetes bacterium]|nr:DUF4280 domain-containing protein [Planctomycetota bacterium]